MGEDIRQTMPKQPIRERVHNFDEVSLGFDKRLALREARRCLQCKDKPCLSGCPLGIDIPSFVKEIINEDFSSAYRIIRMENPLPGICGRVCPQEEQCEKACRLGMKNQPVAIGSLERFVSDWQRNRDPRFSISKGASLSQLRIAIIGSGPAGLTLASRLAERGYRTVIFEALHLPGGVLCYGIPRFRLPRDILCFEIEGIKRLGVEIKIDEVIGRIEGIEDLLKEKGFYAVYIAIGAGLPRFLGIRGENLLGVYSANEFLTRVNLMKGYLFPRVPTPVKVGKKVAVIGGGNVALDAARVALRLSAEVYLIYRRSESEMPARREEIINAQEEGVRFLFLTTPLRIIGDRQRWVKAIECLRTRLGEKDPSARPTPVAIEGSNFTLPVDTVITAIGTGPNPLLLSTIAGLRLNKGGYIEIEEDTGRTSKRNIFAGGDIVTGSATVISAMASAKRTAQAIMDIYGMS